MMEAGRVIFEKVGGNESVVAEFKRKLEEMKGWYRRI